MLHASSVVAPQGLSAGPTTGVVLSAVLVGVIAWALARTTGAEAAAAKGTAWVPVFVAACAGVLGYLAIHALTLLLAMLLAPIGDLEVIALLAANCAITLPAASVLLEARRDASIRE